VWGRRPEAAESLAASLGVTAYGEYDALLADVDAMAFAVPPDVQATLAVRAAAAGRHLLLDKPIAVTDRLSAELVRAADDAGVASVTFFTDLLAPTTRAWFRELRESGPWLGASGRWLVTLDHPDNPFRGSQWRRELGALWDVGPHAVAVLTAALGPVGEVRAVGGSGDLVHLVLTHEGGATSTASVTLTAPPAAAGKALTVWGEAGLRDMPGRAADPVPQVLGTAAAELAAAARTGVAHPVDVRFGARVGAVLAEAARQVAGRTAGAAPRTATDPGGAREG
jgi:predicted dehydrogenase